MRKHPILLIMVILATAAGWWCLISVTVRTRHNKIDPMTHAQITLARDTARQTIVSTKATAELHKDDIKNFCHTNSEGTNQLREEGWLTYLYGDFYKSIYPECEKWTDEQWDAYTAKWDKRKEDAKGTEWWVDDPSIGQITKTIYKHQEPAYMIISRARAQLLWLDKEWDKTKDPPKGPAALPPP